MRQIFPLIAQLNPDVTKKLFLTYLGKMRKEGYRCIGAFLLSQAKAKKPILAGCAGFWTGTRFWCGPWIEPDNVVVDRNYRGMGIGDALMKWIEREGRRRKSRIIRLEAYAANTSARAFYARQSYEELGVVILKPLTVDADEWRRQIKARIGGGRGI